jgi:hypothetical protein
MTVRAVHNGTRLPLVGLSKKRLGSSVFYDYARGKTGSECEKKRGGRR